MIKEKVITWAEKAYILGRYYKRIQDIEVDVKREGFTPILVKLDTGETIRKKSIGDRLITDTSLYACVEEPYFLKIF